MSRQCVVLFGCLVSLFLTPATAGQDDGEPVVMFTLMKDVPADLDAAQLDAWLAEELKKQQANADAAPQQWVRLTNQAVTIHDTKLHGTLTVRLAEPREADTLTVLLAGSKPQEVQLPRKDGATRLIRHELSSHLGDKLPFHLAFRVDKAAADAPAPLQIGADADGKTIEVKGASRVLILLPGNITTGFAWAVARIEGTAVAADGEVQYTAGKHHPGMVGGGGKFAASFRVVDRGKATVTMEYRRPWEKEKAAEKSFRVTLDVQDIPAKK